MKIELYYVASVKSGNSISYTSEGIFEGIDYNNIDDEEKLKNAVAESKERLIIGDEEGEGVDRSDYEKELDPVYGDAKFEHLKSGVYLFVGTSTTHKVCNLLFLPCKVPENLSEGSKLYAYTLNVNVGGEFFEWNSTGKAIIKTSLFGNISEENLRNLNALVIYKIMAYRVDGSYDCFYYKETLTDLDEKDLVLENGSDVIEYYYKVVYVDPMLYQENWDEFVSVKKYYVDENYVNFGIEYPNNQTKSTVVINELECDKIQGTYKLNKVDEMVSASDSKINYNIDSDGQGSILVENNSKTNDKYYRIKIISTDRNILNAINYIDSEPDWGDRIWRGL